MGFEEIIKDKEELIKTFLKLLEDKEAKAKLDLSGVEFHIGKSAVRVEGSIHITFIPLEKKG
jgi:hypothetical protein